MTTSWTNNSESSTEMPAYVAGTQSEPLAGRALYVAIATALVGALVAFGFKINDAQQSVLIELAVVLAGPVGAGLTAWWARRHVNSPATMKKALDAQRRALTR